MADEKVERFNPREHLITLKGKEYLEVKFRLVWMREEHPDWGIDTKLEHLDLEQRCCVFSARIRDAAGFTLATATKFEDARGFPDYIEKAETGAVGRALALAGYGTQFVGDDFSEGERLADAPVERTQRPQRAVEKAQPAPASGEEKKPQEGRAFTEKRKLVDAAIRRGLELTMTMASDEMGDYLENKGAPVRREPDNKVSVSNLWNAVNYFKEVPDRG